MTYTIGQAAKKMGLTAHTLRYYDKEGLLPFVQKSSSGLRIFSDKDLDWLVIIECLKGTGMQIKDIRQYIDWCLKGDSTIHQRLEMFKRQKAKLEEEIKQLNRFMEKINYKIAYYTEADQKGSIDAAEQSKCLAAERKRIFQNNSEN